MAPGGMGPGPGPTRGPPSMGPMYGPGGGPQRVPQHSSYGPGPQQGHLRPPQGLKRPYNSEVSGRRFDWTNSTRVLVLILAGNVALCLSVLPRNVSAVWRPRWLQCERDVRSWWCRRINARFRRRGTRWSRPVLWVQHAVPPRCCSSYHTQGSTGFFILSLHHPFCCSVDPL